MNLILSFVTVLAWIIGVGLGGSIIVAIFQDRPGVHISRIALFMVVCSWAWIIARHLN